MLSAKTTSGPRWIDFGRSSCSQPGFNWPSIVSVFYLVDACHRGLSAFRSICTALKEQFLASCKRAANFEEIREAARDKDLAAGVGAARDGAAVARRILLELRDVLFLAL